MTLLIAFLAPDRLWWLLLIPVIVIAYLVLVARKGGFGRRPGQRSRLERLLPQQAAWKRHVAVGAAVLSLLFLNVAWAMPKDVVRVPRDRATVVVTLDVSKSMIAEDVKPNRMDAARAGAKNFVGMVPPRFNLALVAFAGTANLIVPPTTDRGMLTRAIDNLQVAPATAIGDAIYQSLDALLLVPPDPAHPNDPAPAAIVLLSDGQTTIGRSSHDAALEAKKQKVPVFTIAYGTADGYVIDHGERQPVPVNHAELADIARTSGGKKFSAANSSELQEVYKSIAQSIGYEEVDQEVTERYVWLAGLSCLLASLALISLAARWP